MNIKRVIAAAALTVVPLTASSAALAAPAAPQAAPAAAAAVPAQVTSEGSQYANTVLNKVKRAAQQDGSSAGDPVPGARRRRTGLVRAAGHRQQHEPPPRLHVGLPGGLDQGL